MLGRGHTVLQVGRPRIKFPMKFRNPSSLTVALGVTQPLTEMSTKNLPGIKGGRRVSRQPHRLLLASCLDIVGASTSHDHVDLHGLLQGYKLSK
jgi:hypothetical protein